MSKYTLSIVLLSIIVIGSITLVFDSTFQGVEGWGEKKGEPQIDVWQESCQPFQLATQSTTCQQTNFIIKQQAEQIKQNEKIIKQNEEIIKTLNSVWKK